MAWPASLAIAARRALTIFGRMVDDGPGAPWVEAADEESYYVLPGRADAGVILLCDHAGNAFPPGYGTLGLPPEQLRRHIAYDIGAAEVTREIAATPGHPRHPDALLATADRSQPRRRRPDPHHAPVGRGHRARQPAAGRGRARAAHPPLLRAVSPGGRPDHRPLPGGRRAAHAALHALLHGELEGDAQALARRRAVGQGGRPLRACRCWRRCTPRAS